jgi:hypothetical protein
VKRGMMRCFRVVAACTMSRQCSSREQPAGCMAKWLSRQQAGTQSTQGKCNTWQTAPVHKCNNITVGTGIQSNSNIMTTSRTCFENHVSSRAQLIF